MVHSKENNVFQLKFDLIFSQNKQLEENKIPSVNIVVVIGETAATLVRVLRY